MITVVPITPDPVLVHLGPLPIHWYGLGYAAGLIGAYLVMTREARRRGLDPAVVGNGMLVVTFAGIAGGRAYHVIDQWQRYSQDLPAIVLPPYTGLGVLGAIAAAVLALAVVLHRWQQDFWRWADVVALGAFVMQAVARWGNFFNQELYGPPTGLPWGIAIGCGHRDVQFPCTAYPEAATGFHPLFLYESLAAVAGAAFLLWLSRRHGRRLRSGDQFFAWLIWYSLVRISLEDLRSSHWVVGGAPTATIVSGLFLVAAAAGLAWRHRPGKYRGSPVVRRAGGS